MASNAPIYRRLITAAWRLAWRHKHLWIFGFFATFTGYGAVHEAMLQLPDLAARLQPTVATGGAPLFFPAGTLTILTVIGSAGRPVLMAALLLLIGLALSAAFIWMIAVSLGALIVAAKRIAADDDLDFAAGISSGRGALWRLLGIGILNRLVTLTVIILGAFCLAWLTDISLSPPALIIYLTAYVICVLIAACVGIAAVYAAGYVMIDDRPLGRAVRDGWRLLCRNWLASLETAVVLLFVDFAVGLTTLAALIAIGVPCALLLNTVEALNLPGLAVGLLYLLLVGLTAAVVAVGSFLTVFRVSAWTLAWGALAKGGLRPKLLRLTDALFMKKR